MPALHTRTRRSRTTITIFTLLVVSCGYFLLHLLVSPSQSILPLFLGTTSASQSQRPPATYHNYTSAYSFDLNLAVNPDWMARVPDDAYLSSLSIPGTHDTMTFDLMTNDVFQCQNHDLGTQLQAGLRYFDIRGRLLVNASVGASRPAGAAAPDPKIGIFHGHVPTGYVFEDVLLTVFSFLDAHPSEGIIMRVKEEGAPVPYGDPGEEWATGANDDNDTRAFAFEDAFDHYRLAHPHTAPGCAEHLLHPWPPAAAGARAVPTMGELRGRVLVLYEFPTRRGPASGHGIPWDPPPPPGSGRHHIALEDLWVILDPSRLDDKWDAVRTHLRRAAAAGQDDDDVLFLSHLSASVGVLPVEAAAGPLGERGSRRNGTRIEGINDRTGRWLEEGGGGKTGVVMGDFMGARLVGDILGRNEWLVGGGA